jgi:cytochrome c oxidase subunit 3
MSMSSDPVIAQRPGTKTWDGGNLPMGARYGKLMMWIFLISDAFTFSGLLISYGMIRSTEDYWPDPDLVFNAAPWIGHGYPLLFVGIMTFILIASSLTMVLAVEAGHQKNRMKAAFWMFWTIVGGAMFLGCQAWEWTHLILGDPEHGLAPTRISGNMWGPVVDGVATAGPLNFGNFFFTITGFHGGHVFSGVIINIIIFANIINGVYDRSGDYEMVEKVGLYWHFVDLVWVFVFTFFYLV